MKIFAITIFLSLSFFSFIIDAISYQAPSSVASAITNANKNRIQEKLNLFDNTTNITALEQYLYMTNHYLKQNARFLYIQVGLQSKQLKTRQRVMETMLQKSEKDKDSMNILMKNIVFFNENDFSDKSKNMIIEKYKNGDTRDYIRLIGVSHLRSEIPYLKANLINESEYTQGVMWYSSDGWSARLALARMGSIEDITKCIKLVESYTNTEQDKAFMITTLVKDISLIKNKQIIPFFLKLLNNHKRLPSLQSWDPGLKYSQLAVYYLSIVLQNFPVDEKIDASSYSNEDITTVINWINNNSEILFK